MPTVLHQPLSSFSLQVLFEECFQRDFNSFLHTATVYLPRPLHVNGNDVEAIAAELTGPAASLADPLQQAVLVGVPH